MKLLFSVLLVTPMAFFISLTMSSKMPVSHDQKQGDQLVPHSPPTQSVKHRLEPHLPSPQPMPLHDPKIEVKHTNEIKLPNHHPQLDQLVHQQKNKPEEINTNQSGEQNEGQQNCEQEGQQEDQSEDQTQYDDDETDVEVPPMDYYQGMEEPKEEYDAAELNESDELQEQTANQTMVNDTNTAASSSHETTDISNVEQTDEI